MYTHYPLRRSSTLLEKKHRLYNSHLLQTFLLTERQIYDRLKIKQAFSTPAHFGGTPVGCVDGVLLSKNKKVLGRKVGHQIACFFYAQMLPRRSRAAQRNPLRGEVCLRQVKFSYGK